MGNISMTATFIFFAHPIASIGMIAFLATLPRYGVVVRRRVLMGVVLLALLNSILSFFVSIQPSRDQDALMFVGFCLTPMIVVVLGITAFYRLSTPTPDITAIQWAWLAIPVALFLVASPALGYFAPGAACNAIHRSQLEPVRQALLAYQADSTRFPLGLQALQPFYLAEMPRLLCFGTTTHYRLAACDSAVALEMDDFYGEAVHRLFLISGDWEHSNDEPRTCEPMG
jgi:hypothetical protein